MPDLIEIGRFVMKMIVSVNARLIFVLTKCDLMIIYSIKVQFMSLRKIYMEKEVVPR